MPSIQRKQLIEEAWEKVHKLERGFTLIEILVSITLFAILVAIAVVISNPQGQFARARNQQRELHLSAIMNAVRQNIADTVNGSFTCGAGVIPAASTTMAVGGGNYDIAACLVPTYLPTMPADPNVSGAHYTSNADYDTGYKISRNASSGQVTLWASGAELSKVITITR